jgi:hypothetical protein
VDATGAEELREGDQQVDGKDEDFSHRANRTMSASTCKAARRVRIASHCEFATHGRQTGATLDESDTDAPATTLQGVWSSAG